MVTDNEHGAGCRLGGTMLIQRCAGVFHVSAIRQHQAMMGGFVFGVDPAISRFNATHVIHHLSFGPPFPEQVRPLDGHESGVRESAAMYQYHLKIVPTLYEPLAGAVFESNQFSASDFAADVSVRLSGRWSGARRGCRAKAPHLGRGLLRSGGGGVVQVGQARLRSKRAF